MFQTVSDVFLLAVNCLSDHVPDGVLKRVKTKTEPNEVIIFRISFTYNSQSRSPCFGGMMTAMTTTVTTTDA